MTVQATQMIDELTFESPGPGSWELDGTHWPVPVARFMTEPSAYEEPMARGFIWTLKRYGLVVLYPEYRFVNGFAYRCIRPAPVEEMPERFEAAARAFATKLWREDLRRWEEEVKPASIRAHLALQRTNPWALDTDALIEHLAACHAHLDRMFEQHYRFTAAALVPLGDFLAQGSELSGVEPAQLLLLMRGSAPISAGASDGLDELAAAIREDAGAVADLDARGSAEVLDALRRRPSAVGSAARHYLERVECRLLNGFEIGYPCGFEAPDVLAKSIRRAVEHGRRETDAEEEIARVRDRVSGDGRARFDELLGEARRTYRLRDERSIYSSIWALGLMRRGVLAAGARLAEDDLVEEPAHLVEAWFGEIVSLLRGGDGPSVAELAARARFRATHTAADGPDVLGDEPQPPSLDGLPEPAARAMRAVGTCLHLLFVDAEAKSEGTIVRGLPASPGVYEGTARRLTGPEQFDRLVPGDVLVAPSTSEAFNVVLPLVGAIVTDRGGVSHAAIVAREYGIPGVVGCRDATEVLRDGARVRVDGTTGEVRVLS